MPKMKTNKQAKRRFKITGTGKIMRTKGGKSHFRRRKSTRVKQKLDKMFPISETDVKRLQRSLPYGLD